MKKSVKITVSLILVAFMSLVIFAGGYFAGTKQVSAAEVVSVQTNEKDLKLPGEVETRVITIDEIKSKLKEISEFSTYECDYEVSRSVDSSRHMLDDVVIPGTTNKIKLKCKGIVKVGYDFSEINPVLDTKSNIIYIALPEIKVNDNYIIWESIECIENNNIFNPIEFSQYKQLASELEAKGLKDAESKDIYKKGEAHVQKLIINFFGCFDGYEVKFI